MLDDAEDFETQQVFQDFQAGEADPSAPSWTVLWPNEDVTLHVLVVDHVIADDAFLALEAAAIEHDGADIDADTAIVFSGHHFDALNDFDPNRPQGMQNWTVAWLDRNFRINLDHVEAIDPRSAIEAAKADHSDDPDSVVGDVVVLLGHRDDELYAEAQRSA
jgi:hypothetical protein